MSVSIQKTIISRNLNVLKMIVHSDVHYYQSNLHKVGDFEAHVIFTLSIVIFDARSVIFLVAASTSALLTQMFRVVIFKLL